MVEIIALLVLVQKIGDMARRRGRSVNLFGTLLVACWFCGELAGMVLGYKLYGNALMYVLALVGAAVGTVIAFLIARSLGPIDGEWRDISELSVGNSRLWGAVAGGVGGGIIGAIIVTVLYGGEQVEGNVSIVVQGFLAVGFFGTLLGLVSGLQQN